MRCVYHGHNVPEGVKFRIYLSGQNTSVAPYIRAINLIQQAAAITPYLGSAARYIYC